MNSIHTRLNSNVLRYLAPTTIAVTLSCWYLLQHTLGEERGLYVS